MSIKSQLKIAGLFGTGIAIIIAIIFAFNSFTTVGVGKEKAGAFMGQVYDEPLASGWYFVNPVADFYKYDLQDVTYTIDDIGVPAQDNLKTQMDVSITGHFIPGLTCLVREETGKASTFMTTHYNRRVADAILEGGKALASDSQAFFTPGTMASMEEYIISRVNKELEPKGYTINAVKFSDIRLPAVVNNAIIATKQRTEQVNQQRQQLEIADLQAQEVTKQAEAKKNSAKFEAEAILMLAEATAEANVAIAKTLTPSLIKSQWIDQWNGVQPTTVLGEGTSALISVK